MKKEEKSNNGLLLVVSFFITWSIGTALFLVSFVSETVALAILGIITAVGLVLLSFMIADIIINKLKK